MELLPIKNPHLKIRQTVHYLLHRPPLSPVRFVLFGRGRSGTTVLVSLLDSVKSIQCDGEILSRPVLLPQLYVQSCCAKASTEAYGCKILSYHIRDVQPLLRRRHFLHQLDKVGFKIIHLQRRNLFYHALSNLKARVSGYYQKKTDAPAKSRVITVRPESMLDWMQRSERLATYELELLKGLEVLPLTYEEHIQDSSQHQPTVDQICNFLGVAPSPVTSAYQKQSSGRWQDAIANHQELTDFFAKTPYAHYLEDS
ncbi:hypothetical protein [Leptothoe sp. PORK10 BA2]|uniref:hypothetical protein n=1 Tax=Leptothoe sp. PORK10 BA2 TaxID=3110254 RepID=UPI002B205210|nr:hypothetical protein [Leptothoe sp. PORK10 BA2]MEA5462453.1 hypothetical protein [Leptothoe sp. PORK10 BA2]